MEVLSAVRVAIDCHLLRRHVRQERMNQATRWDEVTGTLSRHTKEATDAKPFTGGSCMLIALAIPGLAGLALGIAGLARSGSARLLSLCGCGGRATFLRLPMALMVVNGGRIERVVVCLVEGDGVALDGIRCERG